MLCYLHIVGDITSKYFLVEMIIYIDLYYIVLCVFKYNTNSLSLIK